MNGELVSFKDQVDQTKNRYFANDRTGQALSIVQGQYDGQQGRQNAQLAFAGALGAIGGRSGPG